MAGDKQKRVADPDNRQRIGPAEALREIRAGCF
jgi:hypothetical protein